MNSTHRIAIAMAAGLAVSAHAQVDIDWVGGTSNWNSDFNWSPVNVPNATTENARLLMPAFANIQLDVSVSINDLTVGPQITLTLDPVRSINLAGDLVNNGFITVNPTASANNSFFQFNSNALISGNGILRLSGGGNDAALLTNGTTVTNGVGHTIDGAGQISATLVNDGVISAIETGFGNRLELITGVKTNNSTMQAGPNAELFISSVTIDQGPAGVIGANAGGTVIFNASNTINDGRIVGTGTLLKPSSGNLTLNNVSLEQDLDVAAAAGMFWTGPTFNCTGTITLNDSVSASNSFIQFNSDATVTGGGSIFLGGSGNDSQVFTNGTTLTIDPGFTIEGSGEFRATTINNGLIRAFPSTNGDGRLRLITGTKTNNSQIVADAGGVIDISGITVTQGPGGVILADGGLIDLVGSQTITGGTLSSINGGTLVKRSSGNVTLNGTAIDSDLDVQAFAGIFWNGPTLDCNGAITINDSSSASNSFIQFNSDATVTGGGSIFLAGSGNDSQVFTNGTTLTIDPGFTIEGSGEFQATAVNNGLIRAFPSTNGDGRLRLISNTKTNNSQILADAGGVIEISAIIVNQAPGGLILADGGLIDLLGSQTITGGTLRTINGGTLIKRTSGNATLNGTIIDSDFEVEAAAGIFWNGPTLDCNGTIAINDSASASNSFIQFNSDATVTGGGSIFLGGSGNDSQVFTNGTTLTIAPGFTIEGSGEFRAAAVNNGLIRAFPSEFGDGRLRLISNTKINNSQILADAGGIIEINSITVTQNAEGGPAGEILADGGIVELVGNQTINGGTLRAINGGRLIKRPSGNLTATDLTFENDLEMEAPSGMFYNSTSLVNNATIRLNTTGSASNVFVQFNANTAVSGIGTIFLEGDGDDSQLHTNGTTATFGPGQTLEGEGTMAGSYIIQGRLAPGLPVGRITGAANITFEDTSLIIAETTGPGVGDGLTFTSGTIAADGDVSVRLNGYIPQVNDQFNLITAGAINGLFDDVFVSAGTLPTNIAVRLVYTPSTVDVRFVCIADLAPPFGVLDLADITGFTTAFLSQDPLADLAEPIGVFDLADINAFIVNFLGNCN